jgi:hypothetical protein
MGRLSWNMGASTSWNPQGLCRAVMGLLYRPVRRADNLTTFMCRLSWNLGASTYWDTQGLSRVVMGLLYVYLFLPLLQLCSQRIKGMFLFNLRRRKSELSTELRMVTPPPPSFRSNVTMDKWRHVYAIYIAVYFCPSQQINFTSRRYKVTSFLSLQSSEGGRGRGVAVRCISASLVRKLVNLWLLLSVSRPVGS